MPTIREILEILKSIILSRKFASVIFIGYVIVFSMSNIGETEIYEDFKYFYPRYNWEILRIFITLIISYVFLLSSFDFVKHLKEIRERLTDENGMIRWWMLRVKELFDLIVDILLIVISPLFLSSFYVKFKSSTIDSLNSLAIWLLPISILMLLSNFFNIFWNHYGEGISTWVSVRTGWNNIIDSEKLVIVKGWIKTAKRLKIPTLSIALTGTITGYKGIAIANGCIGFPAWAAEYYLDAEKQRLEGVISNLAVTTNTTNSEGTNNVNLELFDLTTVIDDYLESDESIEEVSDNMVYLH